MFRLACVLLLLPLTYRFVAQAIDPLCTIPTEEAPSHRCSKRTLIHIIWGCATTTIICAWTAIHPNIPPREGPLKTILRRLELMLWTIVAPEILPAWALKQRLAAMTVRDIYNEGKGYKRQRPGIWKILKGWVSLYEITSPANPAWTLKHGHFLIMGGIHLVEPVDSTRTSTLPEAVTAITDEAKGTSPSHAETERAPVSRNGTEPEDGRVTILTLEMLRELVKDPEFHVRLTEEDVCHRAKGDALSKAIFILQSAWFILQCIARIKQGLGLSHLELTTLALASLNGITFILWWHKPIGAQALVRVYLKRKLTDAERNMEGRCNSVRRAELIPYLQIRFEKSLILIRDFILCRSGLGDAWFFELPTAFLTLFFFPIFSFTVVFVYTVDILVCASPFFPADATHVPTFYVPKNQYSSTVHVLILLAFGIIFGSIHCAGWNLFSPTYQEQKIWRFASATVTIIPFAGFPFASVITPLPHHLLVILKSNSYAAHNQGLLTVVVFIMFVYASARLALFAQALVLLRHLPPSAFITVDWTKFYPHFNF